MSPRVGLQPFNLDNIAGNLQAMSNPRLSVPPSSFEELARMMAEHKIRLPRQLYRIMLEAIDGPDLIAFGTAYDVAETCKVSPSTVSRLARHLGFENVKELRALFREPFREARIRTED